MKKKSQGVGVGIDDNDSGIKQCYFPLGPAVLENDGWCPFLIINSTGWSGFLRVRSEQQEIRLAAMTHGSSLLNYIAVVWINVSELYNTITISLD